MVYVSNHRSHIDYLIEPLVLEDSAIRPPVIAAGINLFGGPLGFIHKHVTGAIPIRRNVKDPGYLITLKAYIAEMLGRHDLMFYIEGGRSYSGELKAPKTGLVNAALSAELPDLVFVPCAIAYDLILEDFILAHQKVKRRQRPFTHELAEMVRYAVGYRSRAFVTFGEPIAAAGIDPHARRDVLELAHHIRDSIGKLMKVLPTMVMATAMRPSIARADLESEVASLVDTLQAAGANLAATNPRQIVDEAVAPLRRPRHRGRRGRPVPRARADGAEVLRARHRTPASDSGQPDALMIDAASKAFFHFLARNEGLKGLAIRYGMASPTSFARRFIAGESVEEAIEAARRLEARGLSQTLDYLGESVATARGSRRAPPRDYGRILDRIVASGIGRNVSLKLTQLGLDVIAGGRADNLRRILEPARTHGFFVRIDMESSPYTDVTLEIFETLWADGFTNLGVVLQSALFRTAQDLPRVVAPRRARAAGEGRLQGSRRGRLPAQGRRRRGLRHADAIPAARGDVSGARHARRRRSSTRPRRLSRREGIAKDRFEFQMLYGVRRDLQASLAKEGYGMRVYVPFGRQWFPYFMRRLGERPANVAFVLKSLASEK